MTDREDVDRVLAGLRAAEPGVGMQARLLLALEQQPLGNLRPGARQGLHLEKFSSWTSRERFRVAGAMAAVLLVVPPAALHLMRRAATPRAGGVAVTNRIEFTALPRGIKSPVMVPGAVELRVGSRTDPHVAGGSGKLPVVRGFRDGTARAGMEMPVAPAETTTSDVRIESFPAPPMPLTRQERLLLRMLHGGETGELVAALAPGAETAVRSAESAEFRAFFRPIQVVVGPGHTAEKPLPDTGLDGSPLVVTPKVLPGDRGGEK